MRGSVGRCPRCTYGTVVIVCFAAFGSVSSLGDVVSVTVVSISSNIPSIASDVEFNISMCVVAIVHAIESVGVVVAGIAGAESITASIYTTAYVVFASVKVSLGVAGNDPGIVLGHSIGNDVKTGCGGGSIGVGKERGRGGGAQVHQAVSAARRALLPTFGLAPNNLFGNLGYLRVIEQEPPRMKEGVVYVGPR